MQDNDNGIAPSGPPVSTPGRFIEGVQRIDSDVLQHWLSYHFKKR